MLESTDNGKLLRETRAQCLAIADHIDYFAGAADKIEGSVILSRCLAKRPEDRYDSAEALAEQLQTVIHQLRDTDSLIREGSRGRLLPAGGSRPLPDRLPAAERPAARGLRGRLGGA